jgi:hypothetical protein
MVFGCSKRMWYNITLAVENVALFPADIFSWNHGAR